MILKSLPAWIPHFLTSTLRGATVTFCGTLTSRPSRRKCLLLELAIRVWNALLMPIVRSTKPNPDEQIPVALAARIVGIDRSSLAHLVDHGLVPRLDVDAVRALATSGEVMAKSSDSPSPLVIRLDVNPAVQRIVDMSEDELSQSAQGPHRLPGSSLGCDVLLCVRSFVIATGTLEELGDPIPLVTDRRGRDITGRTVSVRITHRLGVLTSRPTKAVEDARWLGRRARVGTGGAVLPLKS